MDPATDFAAFTTTHFVQSVRSDHNQTASHRGCEASFGALYSWTHQALSLTA